MWPWRRWAKVREQHRQAEAGLVSSRESLEQARTDVEPLRQIDLQNDFAERIRVVMRTGYERVQDKPGH